LIVVSTIVLAMAIRLAELPAYQNIEYADPRYQDFTYIWNGVWLAFVTLTTVGYGDFYPITHLGRFFATIAAFWGIFLISMIISVTSEGLSLNDLEKRVSRYFFAR